MTTTAATTDVPSEVPTAARWHSSSIAWPLGAIGLVLVLQLTMVFTRSVNWDEFWFYHHVAEFARGNMAQPLQSLHVRLFAWLPGLEGNAIDHIAIARLAMLACEVLVVGAIYSIGRRFAGRAEALLAALAYVTAGFVFQHGFSFRTDPMATAALMWALVLMLRSRLDPKAIAAIALLVAVATMITIKVVLYAPAFLGIAWLRWSESGLSRSVAVRLVVTGMATLAFFSALYAWHSQALTGDATGAGMASAAGSWMFFLGVPPYLDMIVKALMISPVLVVLVALSPLLIGKATLTLAEKVALGSLWLLVLTPLFYTNSAAYFYVFMLAPVAASCVIAARAAVQRYDARSLSLVMLLIIGGIFALEDRQVIDRQRSIAEAADTLLEEPVAYFDHNGMLPAFEKANYLMTPSAMASYRASGIASYRAEMERRAVPLLLANDDVLTDMLAGDDSVLLPADAAALRDTYVPVWGPFRIAGADLAAGEERTHEFLVPGTYTVIGSAMTIDGTDYPAGALVEVDRGQHLLAAMQGNARIVWGSNAPQVTQPWVEGEIYVGF